MSIKDEKARREFSPGFIVADYVELVLGLCHAVAYAYFCEKIFRLGGIFLDLPADIGHVDSEDLVVTAGPRTPQLLDDGIVGHHTAGVFA